MPMGYDLIWRGVEITTGAQREHRYDILKSQAKEKGLDEDVKFYLEFFKYGCPAHGGFGLGVDRLTMLICKDDSIRDVIAFPKVQTASCLMSDAPSSVEDKQLDELAISIKK